jgi:tetratricopeptide (TPR) repeat protein
VSLLERAVRFHPKLSDVSESLGDLHALEGRFDRAAAAYQDSLKTRKGAPPASSNAMKAIAVASVAVRRPSGDAKPPAPGSPGWTFSPEAPFLIKLTYALLKQNDRDGAVRAVEQQLKEATDDDSITEAVEALDMVGLSERGLDVRRRQFLKRLKTTAMFPHLKEQLLAAGLDLGQRYLAASRFEEAYAITLYLSPDAQNKDSVKQFEELRAKAHAGFGEEALLRATAGGEVLPAEKAGAAKALIGKLDDDSPLERESAAAKLLEMGAPILPLVVEAVKGAGPEAAAQLKAILSEISGRELKKRFESK